MPDRAQEEYVDYNVSRVTEMRRGLDYLEMRPDLDRERIAFLGISAGGGPGVFMTALESRDRSMVFVGTGISTREQQYAQAANRTNFVSRIRGPKMTLHGRYDEDTSLKSEGSRCSSFSPSGNASMCSKVGTSRRRKWPFPLSRSGWTRRWGR
ncbi:MAG TPA: hypothetical protein VLV78_04855 [Thermoanaerobaculia bacterium]|nr:hypothetical protein [Thermoanaerobaculia bacterium]